MLSSIFNSQDSHIGLRGLLCCLSFFQIEYLKFCSILIFCCLKCVFVLSSVHYHCKKEGKLTF